MEEDRPLKRAAEDAPEGSPATKLSTTAQITKQIDFYFNDSNFRHDKFLRAEAAKDNGCMFTLVSLPHFQRGFIICTRDIQQNESHDF